MRYELTKEIVNHASISSRLFLALMFHLQRRLNLIHKLLEHKLVVIRGVPFWQHE